MKIAVYGGSFNPPHLGHRAVAKAVERQLKPDRLLIIPGGTPPHKRLSADSPSPEERLRLCELAFAGIPGAEISDRELRREGLSYTADTVESLRAEYPEDELYLVLGTDMLLCFDRWFRFRYLLEQCVLTAVVRADGERERVTEKAEQLRRDYGARVLLLPHEPVACSSAELREQLPRRTGAALVTEEVYAEIIRRRFYGAQPSLDWLRERAYALLKPTRVAHVAGCEETAVRLAGHWGEDPGLAAEAAILHDITKRLSYEEQLRLCEQYGLRLEAEERESPKVLHAITAAAYARERFGVGDAVCGAIRWHCTGRPGMTRLEKIVWLADYTEPGRDFPGVDRIRALCAEDLDAAMYEALEKTLRFVSGRGETPCAVTERAREYYSDKRNWG